MAAPKDVAIALTFDFDALSSWLSMGAGLTALSRGEFGAIGARRLLALLEEFDATASFYVPGHSALAYPNLVVAIAEAGHEVGHHGWVHENPATLNEDDERRVLERGIDALFKVAGIRPTGYRAPYWDISPKTVGLLLEHGFEYDSSMMGNDYEPYWCRVGDEPRPNDPYRFGTPVDLVEIPVAWYLDDVPLFDFVHSNAISVLGLRPPSQVLELWQAEFDYLYHEVGTGILTVTMHPQVIGRGHRMTMLRRLMEYTTLHRGVRFVSCLEYSRAWREGRTPALPQDAATPPE